MTVFEVNLQKSPKLENKKKGVIDCYTNEVTTTSNYRFGKKLLSPSM